jgi:hypothetical protein
LPGGGCRAVLDDFYHGEGCICERLPQTRLSPLPTLEPNSGDQAAPERLSLGFSTADVVIVGARLGKLVELLGSHDLASVSVLDARYAGTLGREPWVGKISIAQIGKQ